MNMPVFPENFSYWLAKPCNAVTGVHMNVYNEMMSSCITMEIYLLLDNVIYRIWSDKYHWLLTVSLNVFTHTHTHTHTHTQNLSPASTHTMCQ